VLLTLTGQDIGLDTQTANFVFAGPASAGPSDPTFRALVDADIPAAITRDTEWNGIDFLVGTATAALSGEIVVGTAPGGELGGTWASPTVDATHSGSAHHAQAHNNDHATGGSDAFAVSDLLDAIARITVRKNTGTDVGSRRRLNFIEGTNITLTIADDAAGEEVDVTITAASGGAGSFTKGQATVDFGAFPGKGEATVDVTGQTGYVATSFVSVSLNGTTADHNRDEHEIEEADVTVKYKADGEFTISMRPDPIEQGRWPIVPKGPNQNNALYGQYQITWGWSN